MERKRRKELGGTPGEGRVRRAKDTSDADFRVCSGLSPHRSRPLTERWEIDGRQRGLLLSLWF